MNYSALYVFVLLISQNAIQRGQVYNLLFYNSLHCKLRLSVSLTFGHICIGNGVPYKKYYTEICRMPL